MKIIAGMILVRFTDSHITLNSEITVNQFGLVYKNKKEIA
jgi:hypothetical protein